MGPTRKRDLVVAVAAAAVLGFLLIHGLYRYFPPITLMTGLSLLAVAGLEAGWGWSVRGKIRDGQIGVGVGRLDPLAVARSVAVAKASAWLGAAMLGWWLGVLVYLLPRRSELRVAAADTPGVIIAVASAFALVVAALWLQECCKSPGEPGDDAEAARPD
ncbi:MAG: DUF3180 domain-containing protein [Mycobacterium sp.]